MKLQVRHGLGGWFVEDEHGALVATVRKNGLSGGHRTVYDARDLPMLTVWVLPDRYEICRGDAVVGQAAVQYAGDRAHPPVQKLPRAEAMELTTDSGVWQLSRQGHGVAVACDGRELGVITPPRLGGAAQLEFQDEEEAVFLAGLYVLTQQMLYEDDLMPV